ncbi:DUF721 domain-containing protein [Marivibrio halodurans]|uniref:DUF721 domain-containing protein n=1 Tax=Marivibrio halodurans TaxID=2039722 RepID=A0A8J7SHR6_9PROT|nr:DciA family protein [Marivibrio halodurans]MBP5856598.1 DUF721 domain-containing protein [Marivibrio halodurans]
MDDTPDKDANAAKLKGKTAPSSKVSGKGNGKGGDKRDAQRRGGMRSIAALVPGLTRQAIGKRGFTTAKIVTDWARIVGPDLARQSQPEQLRFARGERDRGTLTIRVDGPLATELMHLEPQVIERINGYFGYNAVARLKLIQAPIRRPGADGPRKAPKPPQRPLNATETESLDARLAHIEDPELRERLHRLGRAVLRRDTATKPDQE